MAGAAPRVSRTLPRLYLIADAQHADPVERALAALPPGAALVQLRDRTQTAAALLKLARALLPVCRARGAPLLVNDRVDVALAAGADGVHLPANGLAPAEARALLGPGSLVGVSCHVPQEVERAGRGGADFCVFGPVWETPGKGPPCGVQALEAAVRAASLPVFALGGVDAQTAPLALAAGAYGIACIRAILGAHDPAQAAVALWSSLAPFPDHSGGSGP